MSSIDFLVRAKFGIANFRGSGERKERKNVKR